MTPSELKALIDADQQATALAAAGNDSACAERCSVIAPKLLKETRLSRMGILGLYANPADGMTVLGTIDAVAEGNPVVAEIRRFMEPGVHKDCLPDWGLPSMRAALTVPVQSGGLGLTAELAAPILRAAEVSQVFTHLDIAAAREAEGN